MILFQSLAKIFLNSMDILLDSSVYVLIGILIGGLLKVFLSPDFVSRHLGQGRFSSVFKAALLGIPLPLCSCGVLPAAASLKKQGANNGATTAFLITTPESGVDSISITYALLDPIMTVARPLTAFITAFVAGSVENLLNWPPTIPALPPQSVSQSCSCEGECAIEKQAARTPMMKKISAGFHYAFTELWEDIALWFLFGVLLGGAITALVPDDIFHRYLGGGLPSMLLMLGVGIPIYICATASTPIAAALILKGVSPGTALIFLLAGPATNMASLTVLTGILGRKAMVVYLLSIASVTLIAGLSLDGVYAGLGIEAGAAIGQAAEIIPAWIKIASTVLLLLLSVRPLYRKAIILFKKSSDRDKCGCQGGDCNGNNA